ncbi:MAG TPA: (deoxy)nucleoside triphosphate pyrophosphohydrolase [Gammaproteobacteria bacterium]|jgi:8-oxo-dGTP diphosphatase|nr:(deoxy)nucleoside triphosphate pyrophosphohydrolase [Gammaproteobacteria bacterium]
MSIRKDKITVHAVAGLLVRDGKMLVAERPEGKPYSGFWEFPGGKVENNEAGDEAIRRELHEELGIEVIKAEHWFEHLYAYPDKTVFLELWLVTDFAGEPVSRENQVLRWASFDEILHLKLLEGNLAIMSHIKSLFD